MCIQVYKKRGGDQNEEGQGCCLGGERVRVVSGTTAGRVGESSLTLSSWAWGTVGRAETLRARTRKDRLDSRKKKIVTYPPPLAPLHATSTILLYYTNVAKSMHAAEKMPACQKLFTCKISVCPPSVLPPPCILCYSYARYGPLHAHAHASLTTLRHACRAGRREKA